MTDLNTLTDTNFNTGYNYQKIFSEDMGTFSIPSQAWSGSPSFAPAPYTEITIPHNLGYVPMARVYYSQVGYTSPFPNILRNTSAGDSIFNTVGDYYSAVVLDTTNMYLRVFNNSGSTRNITFYWRIYHGE